jgi:chromosome partitioning protein
MFHVKHCKRILPLTQSGTDDGDVSDADDFRARATEIFRQLRIGAAQRDDRTDPTDDDDPESSQAEDRIVADAPDSDEAVQREVVHRQTVPGEQPPEETVPGRHGKEHQDPAGETPDSPEPGSTETNSPPGAPLPGLSDDELQAFLETSNSTAAPSTAAHSTAAHSTTTREAETEPGEEEDLPRADPLAGLDLGDEDEPATLGRVHPGSQHPLPRILAIANQKGGVGKTTTAVNLGAALAELGYRVLVTDLDPQGNATTGLGINGRNLDASIYDVLLHDTPIEDVIEPTTLRNLFVVPATIDLAGAEIELVPMFSRELRLRRALDTVRDDFDYVLIDCPPSLGLLTVNGLAAASEVVVPIQCEYYALEGLGQLLRNVNLVEGNLNNGLDLSTIILTMYDARTRLAEQVVNDVRKHFGSRVCRSVVPRTVRLSEAPSFGQPIVLFDSSSRGAIAYRELAKEVSGVAS